MDKLAGFPWNIFTWKFNNGNPRMVWTTMTVPLVHVPREGDLVTDEDGVDIYEVTEVYPVTRVLYAKLVM